MSSYLRRARLGESLANNFYIDFTESSSEIREKKKKAEDYTEVFTFILTLTVNSISFRQRNIAMQYRIT